MKRRRAHPEQDLQRCVIAYLSLALPRTALCFAVPNGGKRSAVEGAIFKSLGVVAGVPDICIIYRSRVHFIELKSKGGRLSDIQRTVHDRIRAAGSFVATSFSIEDVQATLRAWDIPLRALTVSRAA